MGLRQLQFGQAMVDSPAIHHDGGLDWAFLSCQPRPGPSECGPSPYLSVYRAVRNDVSREPRRSLPIQQRLFHSPSHIARKAIATGHQCDCWNGTVVPTGVTPRIRGLPHTRRGRLWIPITPGRAPVRHPGARSDRYVDADCTAHPVAVTAERPALVRRDGRPAALDGRSRVVPRGIDERGPRAGHGSCRCEPALVGRRRVS